MPRNIYYAMDEESLALYVNHKNDMQIASKLLTGEKIAEIKSQVSGNRGGDAPRNYSVENGIANIAISGPLEPKADLCAVLFDVDMTTYSDIINSINLAENDGSVEKIVFNINSPGGNVVGLNRTAEKIKNTTKPTVAYITDMAASAAYWLASQANEIIAEHEAVEVGSIGVFCQYVDASEQAKANGIQRVSFRSANAPLKNISPFTEKGAEQVVERITNIESVFLDYIASGRQTTIESIKENYGQGSILIAGDALNNGMIDAIESIKNQDMPIQNDNNINTKLEDDSMSEKIELSKDELQDMIAQASSSAVQSALSARDEQAEKKAKDQEAETSRKASFNSLLAGFPSQKEMINAEIEKGNHATADFAIKVSSAEETRKKVEAETKSNEDDSAPEDVTTSDTQATNSKISSIAAICKKGRV